MEFENKVISREINEILWKEGHTLATAESCTGGRVAEAIIAVPGSSNYFKGGVISYVDEVKEKLLGVDPQVLAEQTAVSEEVARQMVRGAIRALNTTYAISVTGYAGPGGGTPDVPVGTIWIACGTEEDIVTLKLTDDEGRDKNIAAATHQALILFLNYLKEHHTVNNA